jgi:serine/threonine protein kinase
MAEIRSCARCGAPLPAGGDECPRCLLRLGLQLPPRDPALSREADVPSAPTARPEPPSPEELGRHFPQLQIVELLGRGGMGIVYKARQPRLDRLVALKVLPAEVCADEAFAERFLREARLMARLRHPHIVGVHDFGETDGMCWLLMEYVDGANLRQLMQTGELTPERALAIVPQMCEALQYAHDEGIVHRDIKPENVLVDRQGEVKIADFGLAKLLGHDTADRTLTGPQQVMGTPHYMAPEQMQATRDVDHRADIYSLGVVFYEMLTGQLPLGRFQPPSRRVAVDVRLDQVVLKALEHEPERRYQHAVEVGTDVERISHAPAEPADPEASPEQARSGPASTAGKTKQWMGMLSLPMKWSRLVEMSWSGPEDAKASTAASGTRLKRPLPPLLALLAGLLAYAAAWVLLGEWYPMESPVGLYMALVLGTLLGVMALQVREGWPECAKKLAEAPAPERWARGAGAALLHAGGLLMVWLAVLASWEDGTERYRPPFVRADDLQASAIAGLLPTEAGILVVDPNLPPEIGPAQQSLPEAYDPLAHGPGYGAVGVLMLIGATAALWVGRGPRAGRHVLVQPALALAALVALGGLTGLIRSFDWYPPLTDLSGSVRINRSLSLVRNDLERLLRTEGYVIQQRWTAPIAASAQSMPGVREVLAVQPKRLGARWEVGAMGPERTRPTLAFWLTGGADGSMCVVRWHAGRVGEGTLQHERWSWWTDQLVKSVQEGGG